MTAADLIGRFRRRAAGLGAGLGLAGARPVQLVQALPLGPGTRLLVVEFGGRRLLVGQSRTGLATLAEAPPPPAPPA